MPESPEVRRRRTALMTAARLAKHYPHDAVYTRQLDQARADYREARAVAAMHAAVEFVTDLDLDEAGRARVASALTASAA